MMKKKKIFFIIHICEFLLFAIYLITKSFIDYPKYVRIIISLVFCSCSAMLAIYYFKLGKNNKIGDNSLSQNGTGTLPSDKN